MDKGKLIKVDLGGGRQVKMYEKDAIAQGLSVKARPQAQNKMVGMSSAHRKDDFTKIKGISKAAANKMHDAGYNTFEDLMVSDLSFLTENQQKAVEKYFKGE